MIHIPMDDIDKVLADLEQCLHDDDQKPLQTKAEAIAPEPPQPAPSVGDESQKKVEESSDKKPERDAKGRFLPSYNTTRKGQKKRARTKKELQEQLSDYSVGNYLSHYTKAGFTYKKQLRECLRLMMPAPLLSEHIVSLALQNENLTVKLDAINDILDRLIGKPATLVKQKSESKHLSVSVDLQALSPAEQEQYLQATEKLLFQSLESGEGLGEEEAIEAEYMMKDPEIQGDEA